MALSIAASLIATKTVIRPLVFAITLLVMIASCSPATTQQETVATVNGVAITQRQLQRALSSLVGKRNLDSQQQERARAATLERLIDQRIVFEFLKSNQFGAGENEVRLRLETLAAELKRIEKSIDDHLSDHDLSLAELEFQIAWEVSWPRYLATQLTDKNLEAHFRRHQRQFDGTQLRVAHLLLKSSRSASLTETSIGTPLERAEQIRESLLKKTIQWDDAVRQFSDAPTRGSGGDIGWISMKGPMPRSFTQAAFALDEGEIGEPVETTLGAHLIKCLEIKPGEIGWRDAIEPLKEDARRRLFNNLVAKHRPNADVTYGPNEDGN